MYVCICVYLWRETERERKGFILRNWLLLGLSCLKSRGQAGNLGRVGAAVESKDSVEASFFLFREPLSFKAFD